MSLPLERLLRHGRGCSPRRGLVLTSPSRSGVRRGRRWVRVGWPRTAMDTELRPVRRYLRPGGYGVLAAGFRTWMHPPRRRAPGQGVHIGMALQVRDFACRHDKRCSPVGRSGSMLAPLRLGLAVGVFGRRAVSAWMRSVNPASSRGRSRSSST